MIQEDSSGCGLRPAPLLRLQVPESRAQVEVEVEVDVRSRVYPRTETYIEYIVMKRDRTISEDQNAVAGCRNTALKNASKVEVEEARLSMLAEERASWLALNKEKQETRDKRQDEHQNIQDAI